MLDIAHQGSYYTFVIAGEAILPRLVATNR